MPSRYATLLEEPEKPSETTGAPAAAQTTSPTLPFHLEPESENVGPSPSESVDEPRDQLEPRPPEVLESAAILSQTARSEDLSSARPYGRTPRRRHITRYAFEFFQDQIENLRAFSLQEKLRGDKGSMSEMVRDAIDDYIAARQRRKP